MTSLRRECNYDVIVASNPECLLRYGRRIGVALSATQEIQNSPVASKLLETALQEVATPPPRAQGEDTFGVVEYRSASEARPVLRSQPTQSVSSIKLERAMRD